MDNGGHPSIPSGPAPSVLLVFQFKHNLLFLAVFQVLNFRSHFEALNDIFWEVEIVEESAGGRSCRRICWEVKVAE